MLRNYATVVRSRLQVLLLFFLLCGPASVMAFHVNIQEIDPSMIEDLETKDKVDKKKDKETKDIIEINDRFFYSLGIDVAFVLMTILLVYYPNYRKMDTIFTFILFNIVIFLLTFVLNKVKISMGAAFGLFAVFSMLRYRTAGIGMKDMTYLFIFIAIGLISGIQLDYYKLLVICGIIFAVTLILDSKLILKREMSKSIMYEKIDLVSPEHHHELIEELRIRTGLKIHRIVINKLDYLKDTASIRIYYYE